MNEEVNLWDEIIDDELHKQIYNLGFQKGKLEERERVLELLEDAWLNCFSKIPNVKIDEAVIKLQKEIKVSGDSLTEFWDNPEDDRWDKEYNPDLLPETLKNKEEKQNE